MTHGRGRWGLWFVLLAAALLIGASPDAPAQTILVDGEAGGDETTLVIEPGLIFNNDLWVMIAGCMVFLMHLGFATVEAGLTRSKNTVNILFKNTMILCIGFIAYGICGFALMYPGFAQGAGQGWFGFAGFGFLAQDAATLAEPRRLIASGAALPLMTATHFFFQALLCATACSIVSGAVAGRTRLPGFLMFVALFTLIAYPVIGSWTWGGGWAHELGFHDLAGSTVVHGVGGGAALVYALILGPRLGKYARDGSVQPIPGHAMPLAAIGVFLLWFGWLGFNGGAAAGADPAAVPHVLCATMFAATAGGLVATKMSWLFGGGKPDLSMTLNGILAGLVSISAGADQMALWEALVIGGIAGAVVYCAVLLFDRARLDDPVGAISIHGVCGLWGTLAVGLFGDLAGNKQLMVQLIGGSASVGAAMLFAAAVLLTLKATVGLRVGREEELEGLDLGEHDMSAYPDFQRTYIKSYHAREI